MTTVLKVTGLHAGYGRAEVLRGIGIEVDCASVCSVIGPNGAGKSTMLAALMGLLPARGEILFEGENIAGLSLEQRVLRGISLVPEKRELFGSMTVADNLLLGGWRPRSQGDGRWRDTLDQIYALFPRLHERQSQLAGTLSGGERQMLAIGRAMMGRPKLLMLDEPSLGLAPRIVGEILQTIDRLRASGVTVLLVEQNARAALAISQYGYVLETGDVALSGTASSLADDPRVIESYLGAAA
jgi:branched-chain amino acid transport system ATP-binding protein